MIFKLSTCRDTIPKARGSSPVRRKMDKPPPYSSSDPNYPASPGGYPYPQGAPPYPQGAPPYPQAQGPYPYVAGTPQVAYAGPNYGVPPQTTVVVQPSSVSVTTITFGRDPILLTCPHCHHYGLTNVHPEAGCLAWLICGLLCLFGFWLGCCLIPFCVDADKNVKHTCASCHRQVGYYAPL
ncbi:unnamed protein product [Calicophoron daubneyi]|uniref:LITAF domain-containing protein n=1 Tax=Calicophoron daubneyi TaxID=300641 RepID=A0AAV2TTW8_CALDB